MKNVSNCTMWEMWLAQDTLASDGGYFLKRLGDEVYLCHEEPQFFDVSALEGVEEIKW